MRGEIRVQPEQEKQAQKKVFQSPCLDNLSVEQWGTSTSTSSFNFGSVISLPLQSHQLHLQSVLGVLELALLVSYVFSLRTWLNRSATPETQVSGEVTEFFMGDKLTISLVLWPQKCAHSCWPNFKKFTSNLIVEVIIYGHILSLLIHIPPILPLDLHQRIFETAMLITTKRNVLQRRFNILNLYFCHKVLLDLTTRGRSSLPYNTD